VFTSTVKIHWVVDRMYGQQGDHDDVERLDHGVMLRLPITPTVTAVRSEDRCDDLALLFQPKDQGPTCWYSLSAKI
jgi:hypothetical protein